MKFVDEDHDDNVSTLVWYKITYNPNYRNNQFKNQPKKGMPQLLKISINQHSFGGENCGTGNTASKF